MQDLIERQAAFEAIMKAAQEIEDNIHLSLTMAQGARAMAVEIERLPSAQPEIIHCEDCKWWEKMKLNDKKGYCHAAKHAHYSANWEISIYRTTSQSFFCADAERREHEAD